MSSPGRDEPRAAGERPAIPISDQEVADLCWLVEWRLKQRYRWMPEWEEIRAIGISGMWNSLVRIEQTNACRRTTAAIHGAEWAVLSWLRSGKNWRRYRSRRGEPLPQLISYENLDTPGARRQGRQRIPEPLVPDFAEQVVSELSLMEWAEQLVRNRVISGLDWEIVYRTVMLQEDELTVAEELDLSFRELLERKDEVLALLKEVFPCE